MKKIFTTFALAAFAVCATAQPLKATATQTQEYLRVEFTMPIVNDGSGQTSVQAVGSLGGSAWLENALDRPVDFSGAADRFGLEE